MYCKKLFNVVYNMLYNIAVSEALTWNSLVSLV